MASTYSPSLKLELIGDGDQSGIWGQTINNNLGTLLEQAITGVQSIVMSNADYTMSDYNGVSDEARNAVLVATGTNSAIRKIIAPLVNKTFIVVNNTTGGYAITIGGATGAAVTIPNAVTAQVYCDGTNFYSSQTGSAGNFTVNGTLTAAGITDTSTLSVSGVATLATGSISGIMTAPTAAVGTNTTQIATTAFALANGIPSGLITLWSGSIASIPSGWYLCNGANGTPDLRDRFVVGAGSTYSVAATGGTADAVVVSHTHTATVTDPGHLHSFGGYITNVNGGGTSAAIGGSGYQPSTGTNTASATTGISVSNASTGVSGTNANLPPYYALAYIMKA